MKIRIFGIGLALMCLLPASVFAGPENVKMQDLRSLLNKWVETKKLISKEKQQWQEQKEVLRGRLDPVDNQIEKMQQKIKQTQEQIAAAEQKNQKLTDKNQRLQKSVALLKTHIGQLESQLQDLVPSLPAPLQDKISKLTQQLPQDSAEVKLGLSQRYQNVVGILNEINKFNNEVVVTTEVRKIAAEQRLEVKVMYFGLAQAYFCNNSGTVGGYGVPAADGWHWQRQDDIAAKVASAIAMYRNETPAEYVSLPVTLKN